MILLQNKKTGVKYWETEEDYKSWVPDIRTKFNIISKQADKKADATVEVMAFVQKKTAESKAIEITVENGNPVEAEQHEQVAEESEQPEPDPITKPHEKKRPYTKTKHQNR